MAGGPVRLLTRTVYPATQHSLRQGVRWPALTCPVTHAILLLLMRLLPLTPGPAPARATPALINLHDPLLRSRRHSRLGLRRQASISISVLVRVGGCPTQPAVRKLCARRSRVHYPCPSKQALPAPCRAVAAGIALPRRLDSRHLHTASIPAGIVSSRKGRATAITKFNGERHRIWKRARASSATFTV